jgi:hypothetical protein
MSNSKLSNSKLKIIWGIMAITECSQISIINSSKIFIKSVWHQSCMDMLIVREKQISNCFTISFNCILDHFLGFCFLDQLSPLIKWSTQEQFIIINGKLIILCLLNERKQHSKFIIADLLLFKLMRFSLNQPAPIIKA